MTVNFMRSPKGEPILIRDRVKELHQSARFGTSSESSKPENSWPRANCRFARATTRDGVCRCTPCPRVCGELLILAEQSDGVETC